MKRRGLILILLLLSGWVLVCHLQTDRVVRRFHAVREQRNWTEAQRYCREKFTDLATIQDPTHNREALQTLREGTFWIGLRFTKTWKWIYGHKDVSLKPRFLRWSSGKPDNKNCVVISERGGWSDRGCGDKLHMMCYSAEYDKHILVKQLLNWTEAQTYCRSRYTSLSSIRSEEDNSLLTSLLQSSPVLLRGVDNSEEDSETDGETDSETDSEDSNSNQAWIGLYRRRWMWSDRSVATYSKRKHDGNCVLMDSSSGDWSNRDCQEKHSFLCYTDVKPSALRWVKVRLTAGSADLNDPTLQDAILQQVKQKLEDGGIREEVKLQWRRQHDGKIFHREEEEEEEEEEERAPPGDQEEEDDCDGSVWTQQIN